MHRARRRSLLRHALLPAAAAFAPAAARAFRLESARGADAAAYADAAACRQEPLHASLRADLVRVLDGAPLPETAERELGALAHCPFCGCAVLGSPDDLGDVQPSG